MPSSAILGDETFALAYDRMGSVRTLDEDGRLKVKQTNLSKACINPYKGSEIPNWEALGLEPDQIYQLLRCPNALKEGAASFDSLPVLLEHVHVSAKHPRQDLVVGATGSNACFNDPYLANSLSIWDQKAIDKINREEQKELSCAYRYVPIMQSGFYRGKPYDGIMTKIRGNHVALVRKGRAGPDVLVADSALHENDAFFPLVQKFKIICPHAAESDIRRVIARILSQLNARPEFEDFLPLPPLWKQEPLAQDFNPNHYGEGSGHGGQFAPKEEMIKSISNYIKKTFPNTPSLNLGDAVETLEHFIEENFETDNTDTLDLKQILEENALGLASAKNRLKTALHLALETGPSIAKHIIKKGFRFTNKNSLHFPQKERLAPWMERDGKWIGKAGSSTSTRIMEPSQDPYQSALNFVRAVRKYKAKEGITSKEIMNVSNGKKRMKQIEFSDKTIITIRQAGDSSLLTPNDQVTVGMKSPILANKERKFKFPESKGNDK